MASAAPFSVSSVAGDTVDLVVWRALGVGSPAVEQVLAANPGLADLGPVLPEGTPVLIPPVPTGTPTLDLVQLWD